MNQNVKKPPGRAPRTETTARPGRTKVSAKHQVTIPASAFVQAGLHPGDVLTVEAVAPGRVVLSNLDAELDRFKGALTGGFPDGFLDELRGEWE